MRHFLSMPDPVGRLTSGMFLCPFETSLIASSSQAHGSFAAHLGAFFRTVTVALIALLAHYQRGVTPRARKDPSNYFFAFQQSIRQSDWTDTTCIYDTTTASSSTVPGDPRYISDPFRFAGLTFSIDNAHGNLSIGYTGGDGG
ncbi:MAG: hypothetical protein IT342_26450 [Candidatus Melainabacteria bacterium]|nr:hypothetical protein [Candidatus Melainabacteria bacterium]